MVVSLTDGCAYRALLLLPPMLLGPSLDEL